VLRRRYITPKNGPLLCCYKRGNSWWNKELADVFAMPFHSTPRAWERHQQTVKIERNHIATRFGAC